MKKVSHKIIQNGEEILLDSSNIVAGNKLLPDALEDGILKAYQTLITEPYNQLATTIANFGFRPSYIILDSVILASGYASTGYVGNGTHVKYIQAGSGNYTITGNYGVFLSYDGVNNALKGLVTITDTGFEIDWELEGTLTGASGNRRIIVTAYA